MLALRYATGIVRSLLAHWDTVLRPMLAAVGGGPLIEIGCGGTTTRLAELAVGQGMTMHAIDPAPRFDVAALEARYGERLCFHRRRSHDALEEIGAPAAVVIDGDHNWYTVRGELQRLQAGAEAAGRPFPLTFLHDVEWPYARRDMYYDPDSIPERWRQPWRRQGIRWGQSTLDQRGGGVNPHLANAIEEGGQRNGVLTAVEDFLAESDLVLEVRIVRGDAGLGVLVAAELLRENPGLRRLWERLGSPEFLEEQVKALSLKATELAASLIEARRREIASPSGEQPSRAAPEGGS